MLKNILSLSNVQPLKKAEQSSINGGSNCFLTCRQEYMSCLGSGGANCLAEYNLCRSAC